MYRKWCAQRSFIIQFWVLAMWRSSQGPNVQKQVYRACRVHFDLTWHKIDSAFEHMNINRTADCVWQFKTASAKIYAWHWKICANANAFDKITINECCFIVSTAFFYACITIDSSTFSGSLQRTHNFFSHRIFSFTVKHNSDVFPIFFFLLRFASFVRIVVLWWANVCYAHT